MSEKKRLPSIPQYYPTIKKLLSADDDELKTFISRRKKTSLEYLLRETLSLLGSVLSEKETQTKRQLNTISETLNDVKDQLQRSVAAKINEAVLATLSKVKEGLTQTLIKKNDERQTSAKSKPK